VGKGGFSRNLAPEPAATAARPGHCFPTTPAKHSDSGRAATALDAATSGVLARGFLDEIIP
jgi:hypothetical protein